MTPVEVHCCNLDERDPDRDLLLVTEAERQQAARHRHADDVRHAIATRAVVREVLAARLHVRPLDIAYRYGEWGKPFVAGSAIGFSLAHAGPLLLLVLAERRHMGCDVEAKVDHGDLPDIAATCFAGAETERMAGGAAWLDGFYDCWTRKEAYIKATGRGMSLAMDSFHLADAPFRAVFPGGADLGWSAVSWDPCPGYRAAIVAEGQPLRLSGALPVLPAPRSGQRPS